MKPGISLAVCIAVLALLSGIAEAQFVMAGGTTLPSPLPITTPTGNQPLCAPPAVLGINNTGIPGVFTSVYKHWIAVASPERMWGSAPAPDLDQHPALTTCVIIVIDLDTNTFWNTGLPGYNPSIFETAEGVTIAFEQREVELYFQPPPPNVTGYPSLVFFDSNGDGDTLDRVIVLYTYLPNAGYGPKGFTRILAPPGSAGFADEFARPSLTRDWLACEFRSGQGIVGVPNPPACCPPVPRDIYVWYLGGLVNYSDPPGASHPTHMVKADPVPWPHVLDLVGYRPAVSSPAAGSGHDPWLVYERSEFYINVNLNPSVDGDQLDYGYFRRKINGVASGVAAVVGQPVPPSTTIIVSSVKPVLGGQLPFPDNEGSVGNLVSAGGNVPGIPWTNPHEATDFGDRAIRPGVSFGNVVGFSRFGTPPEPGAGPAREDFPPNNNYDESIGFYSIPTGPIIGGELVSPGIRGLGLYPSVAEGWIAFTTREYASNVLVDLDGDGAATHTLVRAAQIFQSPSLRMGPPASIGCGYGPALETDPQFSPGHPLFGAVSLITIFLSPEDGAWPAPAGPCFAADTSLNQNSCFSSQPPPAPSYQDTDQVDIVVRWEAR